MTTVTKQTPTSARISSRINRDLKEQADAILAEIGLKPSQAITMFYTQIVRQRWFPLNLKIPNEETIAALDALRDPEARKTANRFSSVEDMMSDLTS